MSNLRETGTIVHEGKTYKQVGLPEDVEKFEPQSMVVMNLELKGSTYVEAPHGEYGVVLSKYHVEDDTLYWLPAVQFSTEKRMVNPDYLIVVQKPDGTPYSSDETERLKQMEINTKLAREKKEKESK
jgi:hypothetical protein